MLVTQSFLTVCNPMDYSPPGSSVQGFSRQEYWSREPFPSPGDFPDPETEPKFLVLHADSLLSKPQGKPISGQRKNQRKRLRRSELRGVPIAKNAWEQEKSFLVQGAAKVISLSPRGVNSNLRVFSLGKATLC